MPARWPLWKLCTLATATMVTMVCLNDTKTTLNQHPKSQQTESNALVASHQNRSRGLQRIRDTEYHHPIHRFKSSYTLGDLNVYLYSAFLDDRIQPNVIRIFGVQNSLINITDLSCQAKSSIALGKHVVWVSNATWTYIDTFWPNWSPYFAIHIECELPSGLSIPDDITLYIRSQSYIKVTMPLERAIEPTIQHSLAVCVKPITGPFYVPRLVEWFETQRLAGVDTFILYDADLTGMGRYALQYYESLGLAKIIPFPYLASVLLKSEKHIKMTPEERYGVYQQIYLVALQDALYRFYKTYKYLVVIDLDEVILPTNLQEPLHSVLDRLDSGNPRVSSFLFPTAWHFEEAHPLDEAGIPETLYMQKFARACLPDTGRQPKSALVTSRARTLNFHVGLSSLDPNSPVDVVVDYRRFGYVHHYRGLCRDKFPPELCTQIVGNSSVDQVIASLLTPVKPRVGTVLDHLQLP